MFDSVREDPRFKAVLKKMGLPYVSADEGGRRSGTVVAGATEGTAVARIVVSGWKLHLAPISRA